MERVATVGPERSTGKVAVLDLSTGKEERIPLPPSWYIWSLGWTPDGEGVYLAGGPKGYFIDRLPLDGTLRAIAGRPTSVFGQQTNEDYAWLFENF